MKNHLHITFWLLMWSRLREKGKILRSVIVETHLLHAPMVAGEITQSFELNEWKSNANDLLN